MTQLQIAGFSKFRTEVVFQINGARIDLSAGAEHLRSPFDLPPLKQGDIVLMWNQMALNSTGATEARLRIASSSDDLNMSDAMFDPAFRSAIVAGSFGTFAMTAIGYAMQDMPVPTMTLGITAFGGTAHIPNGQFYARALLLTQT